MSSFFSRQEHLHEHTRPGLLRLFHRHPHPPVRQATVLESKGSYVHHSWPLNGLDVYNVCFHAPIHHTALGFGIRLRRLYLHLGGHHIHDQMPREVLARQV